MRGSRNRGVSMTRRFVSYYAALCIAFFACVSPVQAALPALVLVEVAAEFGGGLILQNVARQVIVSIGVAANDASWIQLGTLAARVLGILRLASSGGTVYEVPMQADTPVPSPVSRPPVGDPGSYDNPLHFSDPAVVYTVTATNLCEVQNWRSTDGLTHKLPVGTYSAASLLAACQAVQAFSADSSYLPVTAQEVEPGTVDPVCQTFGAGASSFQICALRFMLDYGGYIADLVGPGGHSGVSVQVKEGPDGVKRLARSSSGFLPDVNDPDWTQAEKDAWSSPSAVQFRNAASSQFVNLSVEADKMVIRSSSAASADALVRQATFNAEALPVAVSEQLVKNTSPDAAIAAATSGSNTGSQTVTFPDDYARQSTLQSVDSGIATLHRDLTDSTNIDDPSIPEQSQFTDNFFADTFDGLKGWSLPGHSSQCPAGTFTWNSTSYTFDAHCQLVNNHFGALQASMAVVWTLLALFIVLKA